MHDDHHHNDHGPHHRHTHGPGHNAAPLAAQWQTPHDPAANTGQASEPEPDFDLVEAAFVSGFNAAPDPTSFLRLAHIPFEATGPDGAKLQLLRVETDEAVDIASLSPGLGGKAMRYDPLPAKLVSRRRRLRFVYFDGVTTQHLSFAEALALRS
jgi:hypothetical protein